jgi:hypothetical protein
MVDRFLEYLVAERRYSESTKTHYLEVLRRFCFFLGLDTNELTGDIFNEEDISEWIMSLKKEDNLKASSINTYLSVLHSYWKYCHNQGTTTTQDPFRSIKRLKTPRRLPVFVDQNRMEQILNTFDTPPDDYESCRDELVIQKNNVSVGKFDEQISKLKLDLHCAKSNYQLAIVNAENEVRSKINELKIEKQHKEETLNKMKQLAVSELNNKKLNIVEQIKTYKVVNKSYHDTLDSTNKEIDRVKAKARSNQTTKTNLSIELTIKSNEEFTDFVTCPSCGHTFPTSQEQYEHFLNEKQNPLLLLLPFLFLLLHLNYGIGTLVGLIKMPTFKKNYEKGEL